LSSHVTKLGCPSNKGAQIIEVWIREVPLHVEGIIDIGLAIKESSSETRQ